MTTFYTPQKERCLKIIDQLFKFFDTIIKDQTVAGLYDINKESEKLVAILMTELYDYGSFQTYVDPRQPSVDLYNNDASTLIQVTTTQTNAKFSRTIDRAPIYYSNLTKLIFFILHYNFESRNDSTWSFPTNTFFNFYDNEFILDFSSIVKKLEEKYGVTSTEEIEKGYFEYLVTFGIQLCREFERIHPAHKFSNGAKTDFKALIGEYTEIWPQRENTISITPTL